MDQAIQRRKDDLMVYFALSNFRKKVPFSHLPPNLKLDIKTFIGTYPTALEQSRDLLFQAGNPDLIAKLCDQFPEGYLDPQALYIHKSLMNDLPSILRIYIGCAGILYGDLKNVDIVKLHKRSGKVTLLKYDDFEGKPLPELTERIKINLRQQIVNVFDHQNGQQQQLLYFKERFVAQVHPGRPKFEKFSRKLVKIGFDPKKIGTIGPSKQEFETLIASLKLTHHLNKKRELSASK